MSESRPADYRDPMQQAATDACAFVEGLGKTDFLEGIPMCRGTPCGRLCRSC